MVPPLQCNLTGIQSSCTWMVSLQLQALMACQTSGRDVIGAQCKTVPSALRVLVSQRHSEQLTGLELRLVDYLLLLLLAAG